MKEIPFKSLFFRFYDRKICDGTVTFSQLGISKSDFTKLCVEDNFIFDEDVLIIACKAMKLTEEEERELLEAAERGRKNIR